MIRWCKDQIQKCYNSRRACVKQEAHLSKSAWRDKFKPHRKNFDLLQQS